MIVRFAAGLLCGAAAGGLLLGAWSLVVPVPPGAGGVRGEVPTRPAAPDAAAALPQRPEPLPTRTAPST